MPTNESYWSRLDGQSFQHFCSDLLSAEGFEVEDQGIGTDGGIDIIAIQHIPLDEGDSKCLRWAVQCKHRKNPKATVSPKELGNLLNLLTRFRCDGFLLITNGAVTNKAFAEIRSITELSRPSFAAMVWDSRRVEGKLAKHPLLRRKYFDSQAEACILLVDDDVATLEAFGSLLAKLGHPVYTATTLQDAMVVAAQHNVGVAILDVVFEGGHFTGAGVDETGFDIAAQLRFLQPDIKVIFLSAFLSSSQIAAKAGLQNAVFLSKFDAEPARFVEIVTNTYSTPSEIAAKAGQYEELTTFINSSLHPVASKLAAARSALSQIADGKAKFFLRDLLEEALGRLRRVMRDTALERFPSSTRGFRTLTLSTIVKKAVVSFTSAKSRIAFQDNSAGSPVLCDAAMLEVSIGNIIDNALQATRMDESPNVSISVDLVEREKRYLRVNVMDNGIGFPAAFHKQLYRQGFSTKGGSGMGFFLSSKIIEFHGGWLEVQSPAGDWATVVSLYVPTA